MLTSFTRQLTLAVLIACSVVSFVGAQPALDRQIAGAVRQTETRTPLPGVTVAVLDRSVVTDAEGRFAIRVPAGLPLLELTLDGFYPLATTIDVTRADALDTELLLVPRSTYAASVDVVAAQPPASVPSTVAVASTEVLRTPGALDNVFRTLQTLPGVSATEEFGSRIAVRGGAPDQNLTLMDGVEIHDPYRLFGLTDRKSVV